jgi:hypothetical protein
MKRRLLFTVDVDRDVNIEIDGSTAAGSMDRGQGTEPRFDSTETGLHLILEMLDEIGIKGTFFMEGHTAETIDCGSVKGHCVGLHGYDHEDLTKVSDPLGVLTKGFKSVRDNVTTPVCFRAPYMRANDEVLQCARQLGIGHDSSFYAAPEVQPYEAGGITEHPVAKGRDADGKVIAAYLWPMHEGKRKPGDYIDLARTVNGDLVIATHSWHIVESIDDGIMDSDRMKTNLQNTRDVITGILDLGFEPAVLR